MYNFDPRNISNLKTLLGKGERWGINLEYREQVRAEGIAQAFLIAESFIGDDPVILMLGDNIFSGGSDLPDAIKEFSSGATIFAYHVKNPENYGVVEFDEFENVTSIEEKPSNPKSNFVIPGLYLYENSVVSIAKELRPSMRGELEISDINLEYLRRNTLKVKRLSRGFMWLDAGTSSQLQSASSYIETIESRQGVKIGCPEESCFGAGFYLVRKF